jgi:hypothetical protein
VFPGFEITLLDPSAKSTLFFGSQEGDLVDLLEVGLQTALGRNGRLLWAVGGRVGGPVCSADSLERRSAAQVDGIGS